MKKLHWLGVLMGITIVGITGFQLYWLRQNYDREEKTLVIKSEVAFRDVVEQLQVTKLKLEGLPFDTGHKNRLKIFMRGDNDENIDVRMTPKAEIVSTINVLRNKLKDSLRHDTDIKPGMVISLDKKSFYYKRDSLKPRPPGLPGRGDHFFQMLYGVDSLQDSIKLKEIDSAYTIRLKDQKLNVPFTISRLNETNDSDRPVFSEVTVGFVNPITYKLKLGNTFPFLIKQISLPILFSILLLGITVLSFVLLYRTLLRQRRLVAVKNEFISNISHELKTPIATVGVAIEALRNFGAAQSPERTKEYLDISAAELQRLGLLVDKVLKISLLESRKIELKKESFDIKALVMEVINIMKLQFEKYNAQVNVQITGDHFIIEADRLHITSVIYNLLDNALKYSKENPVIDLQLSSLPNDIIELRVKDNGIGIPKEYQSKVFDKFFRVPSNNTHNVKGYGLGLSYVKEIVSAHLGYIVVESEPGKGSTFTVKLPFKEAPVIYFDDKRRIVRKERIKL